ncbi:MAG: helix-turn-helix domain-containing protein [Stenotrophobium sp.]
MNEAIQRRTRAGRLLLEGISPSEVAKTVGAPRQTVYRWLGVLQQQGIEGLQEMSKGGRPSLMSPEQVAELRKVLLAGPIASGYEADFWTLRQVQLLIQNRFGIKYSGVNAWRILGALHSAAESKSSVP